MVKVKMMQEMSWMDFVCPVSMVVAFLATIPWGRRTWWLVDAAANATFGLGLIFMPQFIMGFQVTGKFDELHLHICRVIGAVMVSSAVSFYLCRNSVDYRMFGSQLFSRILTCTFILIAQCYSAYNLWNKSSQKFNDKFVSFSCLGVALWLLGSLVQLLRYKEYGGYINKINALHVGLLVDSFMLLVFSVVYFAFPSQLTGQMVDNRKYNVDGVHTCLMRISAAFLLGQSWASNACQGFLYMEDKRAHIIGRLLGQLLAFIVSMYGLFYVKMFSINVSSALTMSSSYVIFMIWLLFRTVKKDKEN